MEQRIEIHDRSIATRLKGIASWRIPDSEKSDLIRFLEQLELGRVNKGVRISEARRCKYLDILRVPFEFFGKPIHELTLHDIEAFERSLGNGTIQSNRGTTYSDATKVDIRRALKIYLRWRCGPQCANELTDWLDTRAKPKTPDFLIEADIELLYKHCKSSAERFLIAVLFDAGARATEFHNIRYRDISLPADSKGYVKIALREEFSKTKGRTISLFWKHSTEAVRDFIRERERTGIQMQDAVVTTSYEAARTFLHRLGKKVLGRSIHYHLFRHSSATYYADKMNRQQLCIRYGWAFSSDMPDVYISRAGMDNSELDQRFAQAEAASSNALLVQAQQREQMKDERIDQLERTLTQIQQQFDLIVAALQRNPTETELLSAQKQVVSSVR